MGTQKRLHQISKISHFQIFRTSTKILQRIFSKIAIFEYGWNISTEILFSKNFEIQDLLWIERGKKRVWEKELAPWAQLCPNQQKEACVGISIPTQEFLTLKPVYTGLHHSPIYTSLEFSFPSTFMVLLDGWITHSDCTHFSNCIQRFFACNNYREVSSYRGSCVPCMFWSRFAFLFQLWTFHALVLQRFWGSLVPGECTGSSQHSLEARWHPGQAGWVFNSSHSQRCQGVPG